MTWRSLNSYLAVCYNPLLMFFELEKMTLKLGHSTMWSLSLGIKEHGSRSVSIASMKNFQDLKTTLAILAFESCF